MQQKPLPILAIALAFLCVSLTVKANEALPDEIALLKQKVSDAITKIEETKRRKYSYQISRYENEEGDITSSIEHFTPNELVENQWELKRINSEVPTNKQLKKFQEQKLEQIKNREKGSNHSVKLRELINPDSLQLSAEDSRYSYLNFDVNLEKLGDDSKGKLDGILAYNKELEFIESITITNNSAFSPMFSANIEEFKLTFSFIRIDNSILPRQNDMEMKGTFAFFTEIDEVSSDVYSKYRRPPLKE